MNLNIENMDEFNQELNKKLNNIDTQQCEENVSSNGEISNQPSIRPSMASGESPTRKQKTSEAQRRAPKRYYEKNKADIQNYYKNYYTDNKEHILNRNNNYYNSNKEDIQNYYKSYYIENKEDIVNKQMQYYTANKDIIRNRHKNYYYNNKLLLQESKEQLNILTA